MDYLKYVPILNLVLIVILFVLWFSKSREQFETDSTPTSFPTQNRLVVADNEGIISTVDPGIILNNCKALLKSYTTKKDLEKMLHPYATTSDIKQYLK